jgi:lipopolysaccharide/colanic/teichoic acid biosynthesis glycosyltransferase
MRRAMGTGRPAESGARPAAMAHPVVHRVTTIRPAGEASALATAEFRALDLGVSVAGLVALSPLLAVVALAIRIESGAPVLTRERRLGLDLEPFTLHRFRTAAACPSAEQRLTRVGRLLNRSGAARLPELWDVARGRMSLIGPRPALPVEAAVQPPEWYARFAVKPGLTGPVQLHGSSFEHNVRLDLDYVTRRSLWLNLKFLARATLEAIDLPRRNG